MLLWDETLILQDESLVSWDKSLVSQDKTLVSNLLLSSTVSFVGFLGTLWLSMKVTVS